MAIASMQKVMIVAHRSQVSELLQTLQDAGIVQILDAERAMVTIEWPELEVEPHRHRDLEDSIDRLDKAIAFLKPYAPKDQTSLFAPLVQVDNDTYTNVISTDDSNTLLGEAESVRGQMEKLSAEADSNAALLEKLLPWETLSTPIEELDSLFTSTTFVGLIAEQHFAEAQQKLTELGAAMEKVATWRRNRACLGVCLDESASDVQKALRSVEFEVVSFEGLNGLVSDNITRIRSRQEAIETEQAELADKAIQLAKDRLKLQILFDHHENLHSRIHAESDAPATEHAIFLEGWVKKKDYQTLEKKVTQFDACDIAPIEPGQDEEVPVEIDNGPMSQPFELITRLYGMPAASDVDPTVFLAPFFALFFGICLTDAAYGLVMIAFLWWLLRKLRGDKKFVMMLILCSIVTVIAGALTGGWFGDMIQKFTFFNGGTPEVADTVFEKVRYRLMWFDPLEKPMYFFNISLGLGYLQIITGVFIGFVHKLRRGEKTAAIFDHLSWFIWLNCLLVFGLGKAGMFGENFAWLGTAAGVIAIIPALMILLFSEREGGWGARIGMGFYNVFSTVFYIGDILSYIRLMALGMVTAGFGMAVNEIARSMMEHGVIGWIGAGIAFVVGHLFNIANSALSSFVHSMRLQFVEFFTKFMAGGGKQFDPLKQSYRYIDVKKKET
ncbi:MAG: V-type ATP synthase subunit I [Phycisphaerae bacterium]|nr:V-type ATP synthase subunit I [Phycisphaerae bacterium]